MNQQHEKRMDNFDVSFVYTIRVKRPKGEVPHCLHFGVCCCLICMELALIFGIWV